MREILRLDPIISKEYEQINNIKKFKENYHRNLNSSENIFPIFFIGFPLLNTIIALIKAPLYHDPFFIIIVIIITAKFLIRCIAKFLFTYCNLFEYSHFVPFDRFLNSKVE